MGHRCFRFLLWHLQEIWVEQILELLKNTRGRKRMWYPFVQSEHSLLFAVYRSSFGLTVDCCVWKLSSYLQLHNTKLVHWEPYWSLLVSGTGCQSLCFPGVHRERGKWGIFFSVPTKQGCLLRGWPYGVLDFVPRINEFSDRKAKAIFLAVLATTLFRC